MGLSYVSFRMFFFTGLKTPPEDRWISKVGEFGNIEPLSVIREGREIGCVIVRNPYNDSDKRKLLIFGYSVSRKGKYWFCEGRRLETYTRLGFDSVLFDYTGFGESDRIDFFFWKDAAAVIRKVSQLSDHVVLHGVSFGGFSMIHALVTIPLGGKGILENPPPSFFEYWTNGL